MCVTSPTLLGKRKGYVCQHALRAASKVVIEVEVCNAHHESTRISRLMTDKVNDRASWPPNGVTRSPRSRHELAVNAVVIPADPPTSRPRGKHMALP